MYKYDAPSSVPPEMSHEPTPESRESERVPREIVTAQGSVYRYLPDGRTQRFKTVEGKEYAPMDLLVFVPGFDWVKRNAPPHILRRFDNELQYEQDILGGVQLPGHKSYIVDATGKRLETNADVRAAAKTGPIFYAYGIVGQPFTAIPVSPKPIVGFHAYDSMCGPEQPDGTHYRERHLGNKVVEIRY